MGLFESITKLFSPVRDIQDVAEGYCPNCWGSQEYAGKFLEKMKEERIDLNNIAEKKGWIQALAVKHFEGIKIQETQDKFECPVCKLSYKPSK